MGKIERALISVSNKDGLAPFARALSALGVEIISTGGTAALLRQEKIPVKDVSEITGFPEMMDGRVKTLHPKVHGGILALRDNPEHASQLRAHAIRPIDLVVVNLYPFESTVARAAPFHDIVDEAELARRIQHRPCRQRDARTKRHALERKCPRVAQLERNIELELFHGRSRAGH